MYEGNFYSFAVYDGIFYSFAVYEGIGISYSFAVSFCSFAGSEGLPGFGGYFWNSLFRRVWRVFFILPGKVIFVKKPRIKNTLGCRCSAGREVA